MKTFFLLRHATAENQSTPLTDFDRPLDEKGWDEAKQLVTYWQDTSLTVEGVLCSAALRAQETLELLRPFLGTQNIEISDQFYNISEDQILENLNLLPETMNRVLYIGHNPGLTFFAFKIASHYPDFLTQGVNPTTLIECQLLADRWAHVAWKTAEVTEIFRPGLVPPKDPSPKKS